MTWTLLEGDCLAILPTLDADSVDAMVTDPPAGISFMGKEWDTFDTSGTASGLKAGATGRAHSHGTQGVLDRYGVTRARGQFVAFLTAVMSECYRVLKPGAHAFVWAIPRTSHWTATAIEDAGFEIRDVVVHLFGSGFPKSKNIGDGWGTALKPAAEHWILARKPLSERNVAANVLRWGTGAINVDGCRVGDGGQRRWSEPRDMGYHGRTDSDALATQSALGRWPANVTLDEEAAGMLDEQSGETADNRGPYVQPREGDDSAGASWSKGLHLPFHYGDTGGASRFFYVAKADRAERNVGGGRNHHPTVKPVALMQWLCRLITPPGGLVLDPFTGSGTTGMAALREGFGFLGIEREPEYVAIARARIEGDAPLFNSGGPRPPADVADHAGGDGDVGPSVEHAGGLEPAGTVPLFPDAGVEDLEHP